MQTSAHLIIINKEDEIMIMTATALRVDDRSLLVMDNRNNQEVLVHFRNARMFSPGDRISITFNGQMTHSIPPQITATSIRLIQSAQPPPSQSRPSEMNATVIQRRNNSLLVRDMSNNRQILVHSPHSSHFCVGQRIVIQYDTIVMNNPPEVTAIDINPVC